LKDRFLGDNLEISGRSRSGTLVCDACVEERLPEATYKRA
jgi:hypothetical protein